MLISVIAGLVTAFSVYQGCHAVDTFVQGKKAATDTANDIADGISDIFEDDDDDFIDDIVDDVIAEEPVIVDDVITTDNDDINNDNSEQPSAQPRNKKGQFTKK